MTMTIIAAPIAPETRIKSNVESMMAPVCGCMYTIADDLGSVNLFILLKRVCFWPV
jgi:hypothetical protein